MPRVFLLEPTRLDVRGAEDYGDLITLFPGEGMRSSVWEDHFPVDLCDRLDKVRFDPETDMLVLAGDQVMVNLSIAEMVARYGTVRALAWNARSRAYVPMTLGRTLRDEHDGQRPVCSV